MERKAKLLLELGLFAASQVVLFYSVRYLLGAMDGGNKKASARNASKRILERLNKNVQLSDHECVISQDIIDPRDITVSWDSIGGLDSIVEDLQESVVLPYTRPDLFRTGSTLLQPPSGVLLYGPPGCGKTMLAKAVAKACNCAFINLQVSSIHDKWFGESQKFTQAVFTLARKVAPCIIFIDEIDSFLRERSSTDHEASSQIKALFMTLWDGLSSSSSSQGVIVLGATNRPADLDSAILRRMPKRFHITLPDEQQRASILRVILQTEHVGADVDVADLAQRTQGLSGSDLREMCRFAAHACVRDLVRASASSNATTESNKPSQLRPMAMRDFNQALSDIAAHKRMESQSLLKMTRTE